MAFSRCKYWLFSQVLLILASLVIAKVSEFIFGIATLLAAESLINRIYRSFPRFIPPSMDELSSEADTLRISLQIYRDHNLLYPQSKLSVGQIVGPPKKNILHYIWPNKTSIVISLIAFLISFVICQDYEKADTKEKTLILVFGSFFSIIFYMYFGIWLLNEAFGKIIPLVTYAIFPSLGISIYWCVTTLAADSISGKITESLRKILPMGEDKTENPKTKPD